MDRDRDGVESTSTTTSLADEQPHASLNKPIINMDLTTESHCSSSIAATTTGLGVEEGSSSAPTTAIVSHHHKNRRRGKRGKKGDSSFVSEPTTGTEKLKDDSLLFLKNENNKQPEDETEVNKFDSKNGKKRGQLSVVQNETGADDIESAEPIVESRVEADISIVSKKSSGNDEEEEEDNEEESTNINNISTNSGASSKSKRRRRGKKNGVSDQSTQQSNSNDGQAKSVYRRVAEEQVETILQKAFAQACWSLGIVLPAVTASTSNYSSQQRPIATSLSSSSTMMEEDLNFVSPSEMLMWDSALIKIVERAAHDPQSLESLVQNLAAALPEISLEVQQKNLLQQQQQQQLPYYSNASSFAMSGGTPFYYSNNSGFVDGDSMDDPDSYYGGWQQQDHSLVDTLLQVS